jgi:hypothetical protein
MTFDPGASPPMLDRAASLDVISKSRRGEP